MSRWYVSEKSIYDEETAEEIIEASEWYMREQLQRICDEHNYNKTYKRKYIDELGIKYEDTPQGWNTDVEDSRLSEWERQREEWGFDERETWDLAYAFELWLYERLRLYNEINNVDTRSILHQFEYKGEILDFQDCIDRMIEGLEIKLTEDDYWKDYAKKEKVDDILPIFVLCYDCLWW